MRDGFEKRIFDEIAQKEPLVPGMGHFKHLMWISFDFKSTGTTHIPIQQLMWYFDDPWSVVKS